ncbi:hypothetical protein [Cognatilysobacter bugurensis]|uniref:Uncharacterized protein n=1 Tax=Cognatilysobacter bugurensis TaxID=543356 RepID=A0A918W7Z7_9GAMM|nr:hypothetical protein [Lysobacter bugurensis]GHA79348.1 hypothetical protein GCM10007067_16050 [Lysobacter bugurensis]
MTGPRNDRDTDSSRNAPTSREGDPRDVDGQDRRTAGARDEQRPKDDPSRAPESGTP